MTATQSTTVARTLAHGARWFLFVIVAIQLLVFAALVIVNATASETIRDTVWEWPGVVWIRYPMIGAGAGLATATLVPFLLPMAAAETLLGTWWSSVAIPDDEPPLRLSLAIGGPVVAAVVLAGAFVVWLLLRDVAVRPKKA